MRFIWILLVFITPAYGQTISVDSLINLHLKARGGLENIRKIESISMSGKASVGTIYGNYSVYIKRPQLIRIDLIADNSTLNQAFDGESAWIYAPNNGIPKVEEMNAIDKKRLIKEAEIDGPLVDYALKGIEVEYAGEDLVEGKNTYVLRLLIPDGSTKRIYLDKENFLSVKESSYRTMKGNSPLSTNLVKVESLFDGYKSYNGIMMPKVITTYMDNNVLSILKISDVKFNDITSDDIFKPKGLPEGN
ncbi:hypothetical protein EP331_06300 [bacterium]|nr:MAG: hypothetical protein EP331_06300 [bacterium]